MREVGHVIDGRLNHGITVCLNHGIPVGHAVASILELIRNLKTPVHLFGPPGFGKVDAIGLLKAELGPNAYMIEVNLADLPSGLTPLAFVIVQISQQPTHDSADPAAMGDLGQLLVRSIKSRDETRQGLRLVLVVHQAEILLSEHGFRWPEGLVEMADVVTVSHAPLHVISTASFQSAEKSSVALQCFPISSKESDEFIYLDVTASPQKRPHAQDDAEFMDSGKQWLTAYLNHHAGLTAETEKSLRRAFQAVHMDRGHEVWDGHPLLNTLLLEVILDAVRSDKSVPAALEVFRSELGRAQGEHEGDLRRRLELTERVPQACAPLLVLETVEILLDCVDGEPVLDGRKLALAMSTGLVNAMEPAGQSSRNWRWAMAATLVNPYPERDAGKAALRSYCNALKRHAREVQRRASDAAIQADERFLAIRDIVNDLFCESQVGKLQRRQIDTRFDRSHPIISGELYRFEIKYRPNHPYDGITLVKGSQPPRTPGPTAAEPGGGTFVILVFEPQDGAAGEEASRVLRHNIRVLTLLGRLHHPALPAFQTGGELQTPGGRSLSYIQMEGYERSPEPFALRKWLDRQRQPADEVAAERSFLQQVANLADALFRIHDIGLIHRRIDFSAVKISLQNNLVLGGFERAVLARSLLGQSSDGQSRDQTIIRPNEIDLACRDRQLLDGDLEETFDLSVDVYAFGALATMLLTGELSAEVQTQVSELLSAELFAPNQPGLLEQQDQAFKLMRDDLLSPERWGVSGAGIPQPVRDVLKQCLALNRAKRPDMREVAQILSYALAERHAQNHKQGRPLLVGYNPSTMGEMLKKIRPPLIPQDCDLETPDGQTVLRRLIQEGLAGARWLHYSNLGFPRPGDAAADSVRRNSKYIIDGGPVVFYAAPFDPGDNSGPTFDALWLSYTVARGSMYIPSPRDDETVSLGRISTETKFWLDLTGKVQAVPIAELRREIASNQYESWIDLAEEVTKLATPERLLSEKALTAWRVHLDYHRAYHRMQNFPVVLTNVDRLVSIAILDVSKFTDENKYGKLSFYRQLIIEGQDPTAFFEAVLCDEEDDSDASGEVIIRIGAKRKPLIAKILGPENENGDARAGVRIEFRPDTAIADIPREARLLPRSIYGSQTQLGRQDQAIARLARKSWLLPYLVAPRDSGRILPPLSEACGEQIGKDKTQLRLDLQKRIQVLLGSDPVAVVQGPPGSGKTTLEASLIDEVLRSGDGTRMIVTSQSHAATDNILLAVADTLSRPSLEGEPVKRVEAIRLYDESREDKVDPEVRKRFSIDAQTRAVLAQIKRKKDDLAGENAALKQANDKIRNVSYFEIRARVQRSTPLVFATANASESALNLLDPSMASFDIAIIDEAAKGWSIDLVVPISIADRVIAVGDPAQLPPHGEEDIAAFLERAFNRKNSPDIPPELFTLLEPESSKNSPSAALLHSWLRLFHRILQMMPPRKLEDLRGTIPMSQILDQQFRSVAAIGNLVSRVFYNDSIKSLGPAPDVSRRFALPCPSGGDFRPAIVWIDTSGLSANKFNQKSFGLGRITNEGELDIISILLKQFTEDPTKGKPWDRLRVMSPYKSQVQAITSLCVLKSETLPVDKENLSKIIMTSDSSQGNEADAIIVSLCRRDPRKLIDWKEKQKSLSNLRTNQAHAQLRLAIRSLAGFLASPERLNVIMSRARQNLILIGDFSYFCEIATLIGLERQVALPGSTIDDDTFRFWERLVRMFEPFDEAHNNGPNLERPVVIDAAVLLEARNGY
jgi:AAA domain